jgi:hypothetical protein
MKVLPTPVCPIVSGGVEALESGDDRRFSSTDDFLDTQGRIASTAGAVW